MIPKKWNIPSFDLLPVFSSIFYSIFNKYEMIESARYPEITTWCSLKKHWHKSLLNSSDSNQKVEIFFNARPTTCWHFDSCFWFLRKDKKGAKANL